MSFPRSAGFSVRGVVAKIPYSNGDSDFDHHAATTVPDIAL